jgi:hypothetical protein
MSQLIGLDKVLANINRELQKVKRRAARGTHRAGLLLQRESAKECPKATGNLVNSRFVRTDWRKARTTVGYTASYAPFVHENPNAGTGKRKRYTVGSWTALAQSTKGKVKIATVGKWKFLEDPLKANRKRLFALIAAETRR